MGARTEEDYPCLNGSCQKLRGAWSLPETLPPRFLLYLRGPVPPALHPGRSTHRLCQGLRLEGRCQQRPPKVTQPRAPGGENQGNAFLFSAGRLRLREDRCWLGQQTGPMETPESRKHLASVQKLPQVSLSPCSHLPDPRASECTHRGLPMNVLLAPSPQHLCQTPTFTGQVRLAAALEAE